MNVNEKLSQAIIAAFEAEGLTRLDMVLKLADLLDVRKELYTADEHRDSGLDVEGNAPSEPVAGVRVGRVERPGIGVIVVRPQLTAS